MVSSIYIAFLALLALSLGKDEDLLLSRSLLLHDCSIRNSFIPWSLILCYFQIPLDGPAFLTPAAFAGFDERTSHVHLHIDDATIVAWLGYYAGISVPKSKLVEIRHLVARACDISVRYFCLHLLEMILCSLILLCICASARGALSALRKPLLVLRHHQLRMHSLSGARGRHLQLAGLRRIHHLKERLIITPIHSVSFLGRTRICPFKIILSR